MKSTSATHSDPEKKDTGNSKKVGETFVNRNERFLPLQCQIEIADRRSLRVKIAL
jgi:hypothetical protein